MNKELDKIPLLLTDHKVYTLRIFVVTKFNVIIDVGLI